VQNQIADHEIEAGIAKWRQLGVGDDALAARPEEGLDRWFGQDDPRCTRPLHKPAGKDAIPCAEIEHIGKFPVNEVKSVEQPLADFVVQEIDRARGRAITVGAPSAPIKQRGRGRIRG
jgi:hypothetical protein